MKLMDANEIGSYIWIKNVKLYELSRAEDARYTGAMEALGSLPASLVPNPQRVTGSFEVPAVDGVVWSVSDPAAADVSGAVTRGDENRDVTFAASFAAAPNSGTASRSITYQKLYAMTVLQKDRWVVTPPTAADGVVTVSVENTAGDYTRLPKLILAAYDTNRKLLASHVCDVNEKLTDYQWVTGLQGDAFEVKAFLWEGFGSLIPLETE